MIGKAIRIHLQNLEIPEELRDIAKRWAIRANNYGDVGSCVLGAGFSFQLDGISYFMPPNCRWQGSCSWEAFKDVVRDELDLVGAINIQYHWGNMD